MKQSLITLALLAATISAGAQVNTIPVFSCDTCKINGVLLNDFKWPEIVNGGFIRRDTVKTCFKELIIYNGNVIEKWNNRWACERIWKSADPYMDSRLEQASVETYLYSDRKTKVTNKVIYSIKQ